MYDITFSKLIVVYRVWHLYLLPCKLEVMSTGPVYFNAAGSKGRGCLKAGQPVCVHAAVPLGCNGGHVLCPGAYIHVD